MKTINFHFFFSFNKLIEQEVYSVRCAIEELDRDLIINVGSFPTSRIL